MEERTKIHVGLDVHKDSISVAAARVPSAISRRSPTASASRGLREGISRLYSHGQRYARHGVVGS